MTAKSWDRVKALFEKAVDLEPDARRKFILESTKGKPSLRRELESLLAADDGAERFLETPAGPRLLAASSGSRATPIAEFNDGDRIGDFTIVRKLGAGSFADVYLARQRSLGRVVALKISPDQGSEAQTMAVLEHPNIVQVFSETVDRKRGLRLICMQYVPGVSLQQLLAEAVASGDPHPTGRRMLALIERLSPPDTRHDPTQLVDRDRLEKADFVEAALGFAASIASALDYAHDRGILHLDVKPENVLITPYGRPMLMDFNVSIFHRDNKSEKPELFGGTFDYMAPEHLEAFQSLERGQAMRHLDPRADIYSLGVLVRGALSGVDREQASPASSFEILLSRGTAASKETRFASAAEFGKAIRSHLELRSIHLAVREPGLVSGLSRSHPLLFLGGLLGLPQLLMVSGCALFPRLFLVNLMGPGQRAIFERLCHVEIPGSLALGFFVWCLHLVSFRGPLRSAESLVDKPEERAVLRRRASALGPSMLAAWSFPLVAVVSHPWRNLGVIDPIDTRVYLAFAVVFCFSWVLTCAFVILYTQLTALRVLYLRFFFGEVEIRRIASGELRMLPAVVGGFALATIVLPLLSGLLALYYGWNHVDIVAFRQTYWHLCMCLTSALVGFFSAIAALRRFANLNLALTGNNLSLLGGPL